jgi:hypothetical protein
MNLDLSGSCHSRVALPAAWSFQTKSDHRGRRGHRGIYSEKPLNHKEVPRTQSNLISSRIPPCPLWLSGFRGSFFYEACRRGVLLNLAFSRICFSSCATVSIRVLRSSACSSSLARISSISRRLVGSLSPR